MIFIKEESCIKYQYLVWTSHQPPTIGKGRGQYGPLLCIKGRENWTSVSIWSLSCVVWSVFLNSPIHPLIFCSLLYDSFGIFYLLHTIFSSPHLDYMFHEGKGHAWFNPFWVTQVLALCPGHYRCSVNICGCNEWINQWTDERMNENQTWIFSSPTAESGSCLCSAENLTPSTEILPDCQPCDRQKGGADPGRSRTTPWRRQGHGTGSRCSWRAIWTPTPIHLRQSDQVPVGGRWAAGAGPGGTLPQLPPSCPAQLVYSAEPPGTERALTFPTTSPMRPQSVPAVLNWISQGKHFSFYFSCRQQPKVNNYFSIFNY